MVACETQALRPSAPQRQLQQNVKLASYALMAGAAALVLVCAALSFSSSAPAPAGQAELMQMWDRPFTTTMLWNAASDDAGSDNQGFSEDSDDDSSSYTSFDTDSYDDDSSDHSGEQGRIDSDLKDILPSSELKGDGFRSSHEWDTSDMSSNDDWDSHDESDKWDGQDLSSHSWDSNQNSQMKSELRKMYHNGIDKIPKSVAEKAAKEASGGFFAKWAKLAGKKVSGGKNGLSNEQAKLYKDAEASEQKEEAKKAKYVKAVHKAAAKDAADTKKKGAKANLKEKHRAAVKHKLQAADKMAASLSQKKHAAHKALVKKAKKEAAKPKKDAGEIGDKEAVHNDLANLKTAKGAKAKAAARKKMAELERKIKDDFNTVTKYAHQVKTSLPPLKMKH